MMSTTRLLAGSMRWTLSPAALVWTIRTVRVCAAAGLTSSTAPNDNAHSVERLALAMVTSLLE